MYPSQISQMTKLPLPEPPGAPGLAPPAAAPLGRDPPAESRLALLPPARPGRGVMEMEGAVLERAWPARLLTL